MFGLRPVHLYFPTDQYEEFARYAASRGIGIDAAVIDLATRAEAAEAECERLRAQVATLEVADDMYQHRAAVHVGNDQFVAVCGSKSAVDKLAADLIEAERLRAERAAIAAADEDASFAMSSLALAALDDSGQDATTSR